MITLCRRDDAAFVPKRSAPARTGRLGQRTTVDVDTGRDRASTAAASSGPGPIVVVGSLHMDLVVEVPRLPRPGDVTRVAAPRVDAIDTTAAGDAFCGALAQALTAGAELRWACAAHPVACARGSSADHVARWRRRAAPGLRRG